MILGEEHKQFLVDKIDENPSLVLDQMMASLAEQFAELEIGKTALYNFVTKKCRISLKRAHFHSVERNCSGKIEERFQWVKRWMETNIDNASNCMFIDEASRRF